MDRVMNTLDEYDYYEYGILNVFTQYQYGADCIINGHFSLY